MKNKLKPLIYILLTLPFLHLVSDLVTDKLGPEPFEALNEHSGHILVIMILINMYFGIYLAYSKKFKKGVPQFIRKLIPARRWIGVGAFIYAALHVSFYFIHERSILLPVQEIFERLYLFFGFLAFITLFLLALTSNNYSVRKLKKRWFHLHRLIYLATIFMATHYFLIEKSDLILAAIYFIPYFLLQIPRVFWYLGLKYKKS